MMLKELSDAQLALLLEAVDTLRANVKHGVHVVGGQDAQDTLFTELDNLYDHLNDPATEIHSAPISTVVPAQRTSQGSARSLYA